MVSIKNTAQAFFDACETGKGWKDYVYVMEFDGDRIRHMTKIWNDGVSMTQLGRT